VHSSVKDFVASALKPEYVNGKDVVEAGALDVNGTCKPLVMMLGPKSYIGTDMRAGEGVDQVCKAEDLPVNCADFVLCMEMLEHAENWRAAMLGLTLALRHNGYLLLTTRSPGFPLHSYPHDHWRFRVPAMKEIFTACGFEVIRCQADPDQRQPGVCAVGRRVTMPDLEKLASIDVNPAPRR
jgi:hypothetical protein